MDTATKVLSIDDIAEAFQRANYIDPNTYINDGLMVMLDEIENVLIKQQPIGTVFDCKAFRELCGVS